MSNVKNYNVGQIKPDLSKETGGYETLFFHYTHELPLLTIDDVQYPLNLTLVFNYESYRQEKDSNIYNFFIAPGYKLNLQKQLRYNIHDALTTFYGEDGYAVPMTMCDENIFTFGDESHGILRRTEQGRPPILGGQEEYNDLLS